MRRSNWRILSADGTLVALSPGGAPQLWRLNGPGLARPLRVFPAPQSVYTLTLSQDGRWLRASAGLSAGVRRT
ncbi:MAG: hypothetical protein U0841_10075 [Chloroflexia bacterium]